VRDGFKIIIGAGVTALLAGVLHGPAGQGKAFLTDLRTRSAHALSAQGLTGVRLAYPDAPYARTARLSGMVPPADQGKAAAIVSDVDGNAGAVWSAAPQTRIAEAPKAAEPAVPMAPAPCRPAIEAAMDGRSMHFRSGSAWLDPDARRLIANVAAAARHSCQSNVLEVHGHSSGHAAAYRAMASERATRVRDALVAAGVPAALVTMAVDAQSTDGARVSFSVKEGGA